MIEDLSQFYWRCFSDSFEWVDEMLEKAEGADEFSEKEELYKSKHTVVEKKANQQIKVWYMTIKKNGNRMYEHSIFLFADEYKVLSAAVRKINDYSDGFVEDPFGEEQKEKPRQAKMWAFRWVNKTQVLQAPDKWYYSEADATTAARELRKFETDAPEEDIALYTDSMHRFQPPYTRFTEVVFVYLLRKLISMILTRRCPGCKGKAPVGDGDHEGDNGCQMTWQLAVDLYYEEAMKKINLYLPVDLLEKLIEKMRIPRIWPFFHVKCFKGYGGYEKVFDEVRCPMDANMKFEGKNMLMETLATEYGLEDHLKKYFFYEKVDSDKKEE